MEIAPVRRISRQLLPVALVAVAALIALLMYLFRPQPEQIAIERPPLLIDVAEVVKQDIRVQVRSHGTVHARTETVLAAEVSGRVAETAANFEAGGFFRRGDVLLRIDDRNYLADVARAAAAVAGAESELAQEMGRSQVAESDWIRAGKPERSAESHALALRMPQLADARARLAAAQADLVFARGQLERTTIRAPYDGVLRSKAVGLGQYVSVGATLAEIFAVDYAEIRLPLPISRLNYLDLPALGHADRGSPETSLPTIAPQVQLYTDTGDGPRYWSGRMVRTEGIIDPQRRVLFAVAAIDDPYGFDRSVAEPLRMGTFVVASIEGRLIEDLVVLPRSVLRAGNRLWVIDGQQQLENRTVEILRTDGDMVYVKAGLEQGERVSLSSLSGAVNGTPIRANQVWRTDRLPGNDGELREQPAPSLLPTQTTAATEPPEPSA